MSTRTQSSSRKQRDFHQASIGSDHHDKHDLDLDSTHHSDESPTTTHSNTQFRSRTFSQEHYDGDSSSSVISTPSTSSSNGTSFTSIHGEANMLYVQSLRESVGRIIESKEVEGIIMLMIIINAIMMGLNTFDFISKNERVDSIFQTTDTVLLIIFTVELSLHLFHLGFRFFQSSWVMFDFILIVCSWAFSSGSLKAVRALRILRVVSRVKMMKMVIASIINVIPKMSSVGLLLGLIMFVFSIMLTQLFGDMYERGETEIDYFSRLDRTILTLFQLMTFDAWSDVLREVMRTYWWSWIPLLVYTSLTGIVVTNIVIAIICDSVLYTKKLEKQEKKDKCMDARIRAMLKEITTLRNQVDRKVNPNSSSVKEYQSEPYVCTSKANSLYRDAGRLILHTNELGTSASQYPKGFRGACGEFVNSKHVQNIVMVLILTNSLMLAIGTFDFIVDNPSILTAFDIADTVFLIIYTVESTLHIIYHGIYIYKDSWASFDLFLVAVSWFFSFIQAARSLRIVRVLRLVPKLKSLKIIITAMVRVLPKLGGIGGILLLIFYIFAIIFTQLFKDLPLQGHEDHFIRLDTTMFTLFQIMTMTNWAAIARDLEKHSYWSPILVASFLIITGFIFLNLIIALICEAMASVHQVANEMEEVREGGTGINSIKITNLDRLQYIEDCQKELHHLLKSCTIIPNDEVSIIPNKHFPKS